MPLCIYICEKQLIFWWYKIQINVHVFVCNKGNIRLCIRKQKVETLTANDSQQKVVTSVLLQIIEDINYKKTKY